MSLYELDTDILSLYQNNHPITRPRVGAHSSQELAITVITVEEGLTGWYTVLRRARRRDQLPPLYERLAKQVDYLARWQKLLFTLPAITRYERLLTLRLNVGRNDLRIAAITLEHGATLVTRNLRDFQRVPNLVVENWSV
ncbi:MAG TPA: type II toxin-antitoxin system VapC family toxin [Gemmataceae bacterium]|nr:type II toxin-antitoxin system VapC family toxin [Gemmataceae bacterium]